MSFNVKHYVAIGLGLAVFASYAMHKSTSPKTAVTFDTRSEEFQPLSSFENGIKTEPSSVHVGNSPGLAKNQFVAPNQYEATNQFVAPNQYEATNQFGAARQVDPISTQHPTIEIKPGAQQVTYDAGDAQNNDHDIEIPEFDAGGDLELAEVMVQSNVDRVAAAAGSANKEVPRDSVFVLANRPLPATPNGQSHSELHNSRWKKNPFAEQSMNEVARAPAVDTPAAGASALVTANESSIIVEPITGNPSLKLNHSSDLTVDSLAPTLESGTNGIASLNSPSDNRHKAEQISILRSEAPVGPVGNNGNLGGPTSNVAPLQMRLSDAAAQQAVHHIEYGKSLSRRGAAFAARQEFYSALRVIAQANDESTGSSNFSRALSQAILAMKEAEDFVRDNAEAEMMMDVATITETHRSKIIDDLQALSTTPGQAVQIYFDYAQQKLDESSGRNPVSAEAFFCLGKLHTTVSKADAVPKRIDVARAIAYHQASLLSDKNNFRSANELGVMMVQMGQLEKATDLFKQSLIAQPTPQTWNNLAKTHRRLGQPQLAQLAETEYSMLAQSRVANSAAAIEWMPSTNFNETAAMEFQNTQRVAGRPGATTERPMTAPNNTPIKKSFGTRLKELF